MEIGQICIKIAGRDAGREAVIVDILDHVFVLIDGNVRRRKCNVMHLEPTAQVIKIKKKASHEEVKAEFSKLKIGVWETTPKKAGKRPIKVRGKKKAEVEEKSKKAVKKKAAKPKEAKPQAPAKAAKVEKPAEKKVEAKKAPKPAEKPAPAKKPEAKTAEPEPVEKAAKA